MRTCALISISYATSATLRALPFASFLQSSNIGAELTKVRAVRKGKRVLRSGTLALDVPAGYLELCMSILAYSLPEAT
jgi:hypothetical protein